MNVPTTVSPAARAALTGLPSRGSRQAKGSTRQPLGEVAGYKVPAFLVLERRLCGATDFLVSTNRASGVESATGGWVERGGDLSLEQEAPAGPLNGRIRDRRCRQQSVGVGVEGLP